MRGVRWVAAAAVAVAAGCSGGPAEVVERRESMSTVVTVRAIGPTERVARRAVEAAWAEMDACAGRLNRHAAGSDVARVNREAGGPGTAVGPLVVSCLAAAREVHAMTGGAFDPTVGPVLGLWREAERRDRVPTAAEIAEALGRVGFGKVEVSLAPGVLVPGRGPAGGSSPPSRAPPPGGMVRLAEEGMVLDLGGIAKGYIAGRMIRRMQQVGATAGLVDVGGDVCAMGERPGSLTRDGKPRPWGVAVQDPRYPPHPPDEAGRVYTAVHVRDGAVVTSGHYHRGYTVEGRRFSHIVDPRSGRPVDSQLASVTIVGPDASVADGLATAVAVLGVERGLALVESTPGVECLLLECPAAEGAAAPRVAAHRSSGFGSLEFSSAP